jgi:hypothetical protein
VPSPDDDEPFSPTGSTMEHVLKVLADATFWAHLEQLAKTTLTVANFQSDTVSTVVGVIHVVGELATTALESAAR